MNIQKNIINVNDIFHKSIFIKPNVYNLFFHSGEVAEIRVLNYSNAGKNKLWGNEYCRGVISGYFDNPQTFQTNINALDKLNPPPPAIYFTLNPVKPDLIARANNRLKANIMTTKDSDVVCVRWLFIDLDPIRLAGISASKEELQNALDLQQEIAAWLLDQFDIEPGILAMSGNGAHILVRIEDLDPTIASPIIKQALLAIDQKFPSKVTNVKVDCSVFNPGRICKVYGTMARKGDNTKERPHRRAYIFDTGIKSLDDVPINPIEKIKELADSYIDPSLSNKKNFPVNNVLNSEDGANVDIDKFLNDYQNQIDVLDVKDLDNGAKMYRLTECIFADEHTVKTAKGDSGFIVFPGGKVIYQCFHDHCKGKTVYDALKKVAGKNHKKYIIKKNKSFNKRDKRRNIIFNKDEKAIYKEIITKDGEVILEKMENYVLWPKSILKNIFTHKPEGYKIDILTQNSNLQREVILDKITVNRLEKESLPPDNLRLVTSELVRKFQDEEDINVEMLANKIGWLDDKTFIHPILTKDINWKLMSEGVVEKMAMFNSKISEDEARENIKEIFRIIIDNEYPVFTALLFALQIIHNPENKIFFEITGTTSTGKSVLLKTIAMLLGWKTKGWNQTYNYLVKYISSFEQYPVFIDEAHLASNPKMIVDIIYMLTQGEDRGRLNKDSEAREQKNFNTSILTTGEKSIIDVIERIDDVTPYGALARTLSININDIIFDQPTCIKLLSLAKKSAGWLLKLWLKEHNRNCYKDVFESDNIFLSSEDHQLHALNVFPVMFEVLKDLKNMDLINKKYFIKAEVHLNRYLSQVKENFKKEVEITNEASIREKIEEYLIQHLDKFEDLYGDENFRGERWGWKDGKKDFYILCNPLKEILKNLGLPQRMRKKNQRPKWLDKVKKHIPAINDSRTVYAISLKGDDDEGSI